MAPFLPLSCSPLEGTSRDKDLLPISSSPIESTLRDFLGQGPLQSRGVSSDHIPIGSGSTKADETKPVDVRSTFEEGQRLYFVVSFG